MKEDDPLRRLLHECQAPEPPPAMDARMLAAFRQAARPSVGRRFGRRLAMMPALIPAAAALIAAALALGFYWGRPPAPPVRGYVTRIDASGFQPLRNGAVRVVRREEVLQ